MQMRSYFILIHVAPDTAPKITQVRLHANKLMRGLWYSWVSDGMCE